MNLNTKVANTYLEVVIGQPIDNVSTLDIGTIAYRLGLIPPKDVHCLVKIAHQICLF